MADFGRFKRSVTFLQRKSIFNCVQLLIKELHLKINPMLKNYLITALRNLRKNKGFSTINILGLSIGLASFMLISLYVYHELNMDGYQEKGDRIFRVVENLR